MIVHEMTLQDLPAVAELAAQLGYPEPMEAPVEASKARFTAMAGVSGDEESSTSTTFG